LLQLPLSITKPSIHAFVSLPSIVFTLLCCLSIFGDTGTIYDMGSASYYTRAIRLSFLLFDEWQMLINYFYLFYSLGRLFDRDKHLEGTLRQQ
jgi:hypothetical protein